MAGLWVGGSDQFSARLIRGFASDYTRSVEDCTTTKPSEWSDNAITAAWIGHATVLVNFYGTKILTDPVMFDRVGCEIGGFVIGRKRLVAPALSIKELPKIDLVLLSHAHMDHMDLPSLRALPKTARVVTAGKTADLLDGMKFASVDEVKWGETKRIGELEIEAFQVNHSGARWSNDTHRGYNGYLLRKEGRQILFGGDTAMSSAFKRLGTRKSDLGIMPIGSYGRIGASHCTPEQAVQMANDANVEKVLPVHHSTFPIGKEPLEEPMQRFEAAIEAERIALRRIGETVRIS